jgi:hypothetical protein
MHRYHVRVLGLCLAVLSVTIPAAAQIVPRVEVSAGYQFLSATLLSGDESLPRGWYVDVAGNVNRVLSIVFQTGGNYKAYEESVSIGIGTVTTNVSMRVHEFLGGVRASARTKSGVSPYGQVLVGAVNGAVKFSQSSTAPGAPRPITSDESATNFALVAGGGVTVGLSRAIGVRGGVDYMQVSEEDASLSATPFRVGPFRFQAGLVVGW